MDWNLRRIIYLVGGIWMIVQSVMDRMWVLVPFGLYFVAMSLLKFSEPVYLLDDEKHPIRIFICLAAVDNETHLRALSSLTKILTDKTAVQRLLEAETTEEIVTLIQEGEE